MPNRLTDESSPYLQQHAENPVDWFPWCDEAFERARAEDKPIFLSVGYSACHWCHVMERESFEDEEIAAQLNEHFVSIKVDREERPDIDQIYMAAVQILTRRGGWPMSVFLTPTGEPFYGGTYWPPRRRMNMPGFENVLIAVLDAWQNRREATVEQSHQITRRIAGHFPTVADSAISEETLDKAAAQLEANFDLRHGGFGSPPKFPHSMDLQLLLRVWRRTGASNALEMVRFSLDKMAAGGIYDHVGGGFARYSVDDKWLVPHFEKMLYDNALLTNVYLEAYQATGERRYERVVRETLDYVIRDMTDPAGGFYSTEDADSEGEEGKFYVWDRNQLDSVLGDESAAKFSKVYGVTEQGNFEGRNIFNLPRTIADVCREMGWTEEELERELSQSRGLLFAERETRIHPAKDDKILASWNGLMIDAMARAGAAFNDHSYCKAAVDAANFITKTVVRADGRLLHCCRGGQAKHDAMLDDYACMINGLISVYEATFDERWIDEAVRLAELMIRHFYDEVEGGFFFTADDHEKLIARKKDYFDSSVPSGNGTAAYALIRLATLTNRPDWLETAKQTIESASGVIQEAPAGTGQILLAIDMLIGPLWELITVADGRDQAEITAAAHQLFLPTRILAARGALPTPADSRHLDSLFAGRQEGLAEAMLYACQQGECRLPSAGPVAAKIAIASLVQP